VFPPLWKKNHKIFLFLHKAVWNPCSNVTVIKSSISSRRSRGISSQIGFEFIVFARKVHFSSRALVSFMCCWRHMMKILNGRRGEAFSNGWNYFQFIIAVCRTNVRTLSSKAQISKDSRSLDQISQCCGL
jgi:hypothetical protein